MSSDSSEDSSGSSEDPEVCEGVVICRKRAVVIKNHARHDIETIRSMLRDIKSSDESTRRTAPRPIWITGYGGEAKYDEERNILSLPGGQGMEDKRNQLLLQHVNIRATGVSLYIADHEDTSKLYSFGTYQFNGYIAMEDKGDHLVALTKLFDLSLQDQSILRYRDEMHSRFYLSPEPPKHPDLCKKDGCSADKTKTTTADEVRHLYGKQVLEASDPKPVDLENDEEETEGARKRHKL